MTYSLPAERERLSVDVASLLAVEAAVEHEGETDDDSRSDTAEEQSAYGSAGRDGVGYHRDRGRDNYADGTGCSGDGSGITGVIALLEHGRDGDSADGCNCSRAGTGDSGEEHAGNDGDLCKSAVLAAEEGVSDRKKSS